MTDSTRPLHAVGDDDGEPVAPRRIIGPADDPVVAPTPAVPAGVPSMPPGDEPEDLGVSRSGALWTEWDYRRIEWGIIVGRSRDQMGAMIGRTATAVEDRMAAVLATSGHDLANTYPFGKLWDLHRAGHLDLVGLAMAHHHAAGMPLWTERVDGVLAAAWEEGAPSLTVLAETMELPEWRVVRRLMELDLAAGTAEAVEHLGTDDPRGVVAVRARMAADAAAAVVAVLTITASDGTVLHISLHPTDEAADQVLADYASELELEGVAEGEPAPARWTIADRRVGEGSVRTTRTGRLVDGAVVADQDDEPEEARCP